MAKIALIALSTMVAGASAEKGFFFLPPGVATGLAAKKLESEPVTLAMHPPEEDAHSVNTGIDALLKVSQLESKHAESAEVSAKQRLLNAEIAKIHSIAGRRSFLKGVFGDIIPGSDYTVNVHAPEENAADVEAAMSALLKVENKKAAAANAEFTADKARLLAAEKAAIKRQFSFLEEPKTSFLEPLVLGKIGGFQPAWQAALPNEVHINYDVPSYGSMGAQSAQKKTSFLKGSGADVFFENDPLATAGEGSYSAILGSLQAALDADFAALRAGALSGHSSFMMLFPTREPQVNMMVDASQGNLVDVGRLRSDLYAYAHRKLDALEDEILKSA